MPHERVDLLPCSSGKAYSDWLQARGIELGNGVAWQHWTRSRPEERRRIKAAANDPNRQAGRAATQTSPHMAYEFVERCKTFLVSAEGGEASAGQWPTEGREPQDPGSGGRVPHHGAGDQALRIPVRGSR